MRRQGFISSVLVVLLSLGLPVVASADYAHVGTFSGSGTEPGQLQTPGRGAVEQSTGNLFVVDSGNDRVQVFAPNGSGTADHLTSFGTGELSEPWGIAIAEGGGQTSVYVADAGNNRIVKYDSDEAGTPSFTIDATFASPAAGSGSGEVGSFKAALAIDLTSGDLLLADNANKLIQRFEADGTFLSAFDGSNGSTAFAGPIDLAVNSGGDVYVIDANGDIANAQGTSRALRYAGTGEYIAELAPVGERERAATVAVNLDNDEVVVSGNQDNVYELGPPPFVPILQRFDAANQPLPSPAVDVGATYDTISGLALDAERLYVVLDRGTWNGTPFGAIQIQAFEDRSPPSAEFEPLAPGSASETEVEVSGSVNPNGLSTTWSFEYREGGTAAWLAGPGGNAGNDTGPVPVEATITGLSPNTAYEVRLVAANADGESESSVQSFSTLVSPPLAKAVSASPREMNSAYLNAVVNPYNLPTTYWFEYSTDPGFADATSLPAGRNAFAGNGAQPIHVRRQAQGLRAGTSYYFRLRAESSAGESTSETVTFTTLAAEPPTRVYEMVSPVDKNGISVLGRAIVGVPGGPSLGSDSGEAVVYSAAAGFPGAGNGGAYSIFRAERGADSWRSESITPALVPGNFPGLSNWVQRGFTAELDAWTLAGNLVPPVPGGGRASFYVRDAAGVYRMLDGVREDFTYEPRYAGGSADLSHVLFSANAALTAEGEPDDGSRNLYTSDDGELHLVGILPDAEGLAPGPVPAGDVFSNPMSADGEKVFFESGGQIYLREAQTETVRVSAPESGVVDPAGPLPAQFAFATPDGSQVFFTSSERLTEDANTGPANMGADLYRYETESGELTDLTPLSGGNGASVLRVALVSDDGATVYFLATGELIEGEGVAGEPNLYVWHEGEIDFIATLDPGDRMSQGGDAVEWDADSRGETFAFPSLRPLTGYDNVNRQTGEAEQQIFVYSLAEDILACGSCDPSGRSPDGPAQIVMPSSTSAAEAIGLRRPRYVDEAGMVFFESAVAIVPTDVNSRRDIYAFDGSQARLISSGNGSSNATYVDASADGTSVTFLTYDRLVAWDKDQLQDVYVARIGGGLPGPPSVVPCQGEACQPPSTPPPDSAEPGSASLQGPGNRRADGACAEQAKRRVKLERTVTNLKRQAAHASGDRERRLRRQSRRAQKRLDAATRNLTKCRKGR